jgi:hypothetical protein
MKTGPEYSGLGLREGIHWHINPEINIEYLSENDQRENITYVKYTNKTTGLVTIYRNESNPISDSLLAVSSSRSMDCIDCHNRPSHNYKSPTVYLDREMLSGSVSKEIPFFKKAAMAVLYNQFTDKDTAMMMIDESITGFYKTGHPDYYAKNAGEINNAIASVKKAFSQNNFPGMKVTYDRYPEHIGHLETDGCFRCHNNQFVSPEGKVISKDCNLCHTIVAQGTTASMEYSSIKEPLPFRHPVDIGTAWQEVNCSECHKFLY